ncbi:hypothetical protein [Ignatzschineria sp. LJL83]
MNLPKPLSTTEILEKYPISRSFSALNFGKDRLTENGLIIQQFLLIKQHYQPFDLSPQIQELLDSLEKFTRYFSKIRRFFYGLPIIGFYFSPLRHIDMIQQQVIQNIETLDNFLKTQLKQLKPKIQELQSIQNSTESAQIETENYLIAGNQIIETLEKDFAEDINVPKLIKSLEAQLSALNIHKISLIQQAQLLKNSLMSLKHYHAEIRFISESLFPLWHKQFALIHEMILKKMEIELIHSTKQKKPSFNEDLPEREKIFPKLETESISKLQENIIDLNDIQEIQQETIDSLKVLLNCEDH